MVNPQLRLEFNFYPEQTGISWRLEIVRGAKRLQLLAAGCYASDADAIKLGALCESAGVIVEARKYDANGFSEAKHWRSFRRFKKETE